MRTDVVAVLLGVTDSRVRQLVREGSLPGSVRVGRRVLNVPASAVFAYLSGPASSRDAAEPAPAITTEGA